MAVDWEEVRSEFPALRRWTYLNTATMGQIPRRSSAAVAEHFARRDALACSDFLTWFGDAAEVRRDVAQLVHCEPDDIAFFPQSCTALSLFLGGLEWKPGDRVVAFQDEFPNNIYYPSMLGERGVEFVETDWDGLPDALNERARVMVASTVNYTNGFRPPLEELCRMTRERGILLYLDGTQSVGALRIDVGRLRPAMLAVHGYKWLLSPTGAAFAYVSPALRQTLRPNVVGWRSDFDWRNVAHLHHGAPRFSASAEAYEGGMLSFPVLYGMGESVRMMLEIGPEAIESRVLGLAAECRDVVRGLGGKVLFDERPHLNSGIVAARFNGHDAPELARLLKERNVLVSARHGNVRISVHFYNNRTDLDRLGNELRKLL